MARGALRGAAGAWLGLIVLQVVTTRGGSSKVSGALDAVNGLVKRALDPNVAAIPDHATSLAVLGIDPTTTGQASADGSSGHQWNAGGTSTPSPVPPNPNTIRIPGRATPSRT